MLVSNISVNSELYNTLSEMGLLCTEERRIQEARGAFAETTIETRRLSFDDIQRVGYYLPHFFVDLDKEGTFEMWVDGEYVNPHSVTWLKDDNHLYGIMPKMYDPDTQQVTLIYNDNIVKRYSNVMDEDGEYVHTQRISLLSYPYNSMEHPDKCAYYISNGKLCLPEVTWLDDTTIEFRCPYTRDIDLILCSNLGGIFELKAGVGTYIDQLHSTKCYHNIMVDNDPSYPIDTQFYPCIKVDKDCIVRLYTDSFTRVPHPEISRLMMYPEFMDISDPYNTDDEYIKNLPHVDDVIYGSDSDEVILDKFSRIAAYCYRAWEKFPFFCNEQSDFLMCDNEIFGQPTFRRDTIHLITGETFEGIVSRVPFEAHRDILFYDGWMFSDYQIKNLKPVRDLGMVENNQSGNPTYVITGNYDVDKFTVIKFNAAEDTVIENIGGYINQDNILKLHTKLNRFYRNMLILRGEVLDHYNGDAVRVSTVEPPEKDQHLWFELLVNAVPEMFSTKPVEIIKSFGLDPESIPEDLRVGAYSLNLEEDGGPESYTELLMTYFKLGKRQKNFLAIQFGEGVDDPRIQTFHEIIHGPLPENPDLNTVVVEDQNQTDPEVVDDYHYGVGPNPGQHYDEGDVYMEKLGEFDEILAGVDKVEPGDDFALDAISYIDEATGKSIDAATIAAFTLEQKKDLITRYITEGDPDKREQIKVLWEGYLNNMDEDTLNIAVYKVLLTDYVYNTAMDKRTDDPSINDVLGNVILSPSEPTDKEAGDYWADIPDDASPIIIEDAKAKNLKYIMSMGEPDDEEIGTFWINIPAVTLQEYIEDIIGTPIIESGYSLPEGYFEDTGKGYKKGTVAIDYGAHGDENDLELFRKVDDQSLHTINYGELFEKTPMDGDIWYEFLNEVDNKVCYSDTEVMVLNVNERLIMIEFDHDNITAFLFDDMVLNFRGKLGIRYLSILADLVNSETIKLDDVNIFYKRLITGRDRFNPGLKRLYTGTSHVVSTANIDTTDYSIAYSTNIGRLHVDYNSDTITNREREAAWRMVIDYRRHDIGFLTDRMMLFVNGHYINRSDYKEIGAGKIQLLNFDEVIACIDVFYSKKDITLSRMKKITMQYWREYLDTSVSIQRPERDYKKMIPIRITDYTYRGFYDVLMNEYIFNGRLLGYLNYLEDHMDEADAFVLDMVRKFHTVSDVDVGIPEDRAKIIIPCFGRNGVYTIE